MNLIAMCFVVGAAKRHNKAKAALRSKLLLLNRETPWL